MHSILTLMFRLVRYGRWFVGVVGKMLLMNASFLPSKDAGFDHIGKIFRSDAALGFARMDQSCCKGTVVAGASGSVTYTSFGI